MRNEDETIRVMPLSPSLSTEAHLSNGQALRREQLHPHEESMKNRASSEATGHHVSTTWGAKFFRGGSLRRQLTADLSQVQRGGVEMDVRKERTLRHRR